MSPQNVLPNYLDDVKIFLKVQGHFGTLGALKEMWGIYGAIKVCPKWYGNLSNSCSNISVQIKVLDLRINNSQSRTI